jgi:hypothetical protein
MEIKGLKESLSVTDDQFKNLADLRVRTQMHIASMMMNVMRLGGNIHGVNHEATARRRKANKKARAQRRINRHS